MKVCIIIPSYNEEKTIAQLVKAIRTQGQELLVIDDGSTDRTAELATSSGAHLLTHRTNKGKGVSLRDGFDYLKNLDFEAVITMDADGQHNPQDIPRFIEYARISQAGIIIGNRLKNRKNMPLIRYLTNRFMSDLLSRIIHQRIPDTQCGFKLIRRSVLDKIQLCSSNYEMESEILIKAARYNSKIESIPIETIYAGSLSQIRPLIDTFRFIKLIIKSLIKT